MPTPPSPPRHHGRRVAFVLTLLVAALLLVNGLALLGEYVVYGTIYLDDRPVGLYTSSAGRPQLRPGAALEGSRYRIHIGPMGFAAVRAIAEAAEVNVSAATAWELGLKVSLGKLRLQEPVEDGIAAAGFTELPVNVRHTREAVVLPPHHHDLFGWMLVAQARCEGLTLMTHDDSIVQHEVAVLRVP